MKNYKYITGFALGLLLIFTFSSSLYSHCEIPCGIYDDQTRISLIKEDIKTIEKSMNKIIELSKEEQPNYNQLVRWINNKEEHSNKIQEIVSQYFLTQRIKIKDDMTEHEKDMYRKQLESLHKMLVYSMKCKQTTDLDNAKKLLEIVENFEKVYFHKH